MTFLLDNEPITMNGVVSNLNDLNYQANIDGLIDLEKLTAIYPVDNAELKGMVDIDVQTEGSLSSLEAKKYDLLKTSGLMKVKDVYF